jgi:energy-coupling factor transport system substrate-specific component
VSWQLASLLVVLGALGLCAWWYERSRPSSKLVALVATLAALAALGRDAFAALPDVKPTTAIVLIAGMALGASPGFAVGALAALTSNLALGEGPWTPWQMLAWGLVGVGGGLLGTLGGRRLPRVALALAAATGAECFNLVMDVYTWTGTGAHSATAFGAVLGTASVFDVTHVVSSFVFAFAFGPALLAMLARVRARLVVRWNAVLPLLAVVAFAGQLTAGAHDAAAAAPATAASLRYLIAAQRPDGGFGAAPGQPSDELFTAWAAMGLAAVGRDPRQVRHDGRSVLDGLRAGVAQLESAGDVERTMLALHAAGAPVATLGSRNLMAALLVARRPDGSFDEQVDTSSFAVFALLAAGRAGSDATVQEAAGWIAGQQNGDGSFGFGVRGQVGDIDDTAAAAQALCDAGRARGASVSRALAFIGRQRNPDGGFPLEPGGDSDAQSTAWAVQALVASGRPAGAAQAYLAALVMPNGSVRYSRASSQTPVWVTAQALIALAGKTFPVAPATS